MQSDELSNFKNQQIQQSSEFQSFRLNVSSYIRIFQIFIFPSVANTQLCNFSYSMRMENISYDIFFTIKIHERKKSETMMRWDNEIFFLFIVCLLIWFSGE